MATYNGHKNRNTWNCSLWLNNDEGLYLLAKECVRRARGNGGRSRAAQLFLESVGEKTPDGCKWTKSGVLAGMVGL